ncbi:hypothetical protein OG264_11690 [Streptomyces xanthophaeus]|uniref:hypothetical protein n=1 Tax=Streptomyces xanthophaeus TaxID=67385 RepID=UPI0038636C84|nr:hypothetical protein OG264_11690 [Streptomyces xanthophaeus]
MTAFIEPTGDADISDDIDNEVDDWAPPTKEEYAELVNNLTKANAEAKARKEILRSHGIDIRTGIKAASVPAAETEDDKRPPVDVAQLQSSAFEQVEAIYSGLDDAGISPKSRARAVKLLKDSLSVGSDIQDEIAALKDEFPEMFKRQRTVPVADASAVGVGQKKAPAATTGNSWEDTVRDRFNRGLI